MTKKFTLMMLMLLIFGSVSFSQTAKLKHVPASPGENVTDSLMVTGFSNIGSITFNIRYNPSVMTLTGFTSTYSGFYVGATDSTIHVIYTAPTPPGTFTFANGLLLKLNFHYLGMTTSPLNFLGSCEVTQGLLPIFPVYTNGSVYPFTGNTCKASLVSATAATGGPVGVEIKYEGFSNNVGAVTQKVHYDASKLTFVSVTGTGVFLTGVNSSASGGVVSITWTNTGGTNINYNTNKLVLNFIYTGNATTNLQFYPGCVISTNTGANIPVTYQDGTVSMNNNPHAQASLGSLTGILQGQEVLVPLMLDSLDSGTASFTLNITYDSPRMSFIGIVNNVQPVTYNLVGNKIVIAWSDYTTPNINSPTVPFLNLKFKYNGVGTAHVDFAPGCVFDKFVGGFFSSVQVKYTNGTVTPASLTQKAIIGYVGANPGTMVNVPVSFENLPATMGAVTLFINFDYNKLTFVDVQNNTYGASVTMNPTTHKISIAWSSSTPTNLNGLFLNLRFLCNISGSAPVTFADGCELADNMAQIVPATYIDGGVNVKFLISGKLEYNSDPLARIPLVGYTVELKSVVDSSVVVSDETDANGDYEFLAMPGDYFLDATPSMAAIWYADLDDVIAEFDYAFSGTPFPFTNALRIEAGDVAVNGDIDLDDVIALFDRAFNGVKPVEFTAPDFVFENPMITVTGAALPGQNFMGLSSGNVLGTNTTP